MAALVISSDPIVRTRDTYRGRVAGSGGSFGRFSNCPYAVGELSASARKKVKRILLNDGDEII